MTKTIRNIFVQGPIEPEFISDSIKKHQSKRMIGGHSIFLGQVRQDVKSEGTVESIEFTAYEPMALEYAHRIKEETIQKFELSCMHIHHSLGRILAGQICLFVFTSSVHRRNAIDACDEVVERIKSELPIWGREIFGDGQSMWKENQ